MKQFHSHIIPPAILRPLCATLIIVMLGSGLGACAKKSDSHPSFKDNFQSQMSKPVDDYTGIRYASDYPMPIGDEDLSINGEWCIRKEYDNPMCQKQYTKRACLYITSDLHGTTESRNYVKFKVYDTADDASSSYHEWKTYCKEYGNGKFIEGDKWFISQVPDVCDAVIVSIYYLEENVMMEAEINVRSESEWVLGPEKETQPPKGPIFDLSTLREYVIDHATELRSFVLDEVLTTAPYAGLLNPEDSVNYASNYKLDVGDSQTDVSDGWKVEKLKQDGMTFLHLTDPNASSDAELFHRMSFNVYDNSHEAIVAYENLLETYREQKGCKVYQYNRNCWVSIQDSSVGYDGEITMIYCLIDNIILEAKYYITYYDQGDEHHDSPHNNIDEELGQYIETLVYFQDFSEVKQYVLQDILGYS